MNRLFGWMIIISFFCAALTGRMPALSLATVTQAGEAVKLAFTLMGMLCLWSGLMRVAQEAGLAKMLARLLTPITRRLFRGLNPHGKAAEAISMNLAANLLGLGNAATPFGIRAMCEISKEQKISHTASDDMIMLVVLNTASLQLIPATTAMLRAQFGATSPLDILPAVWCASLLSVVMGVIAAQTFASSGKGKICARAKDTLENGGDTHG